MRVEKRIRLSDIHLHRMVDDTGIYRQSVLGVPNPRQGYATDDNARLMLMAALYYEATGRQDALDMVYRGLGFLQYAEHNGWFRSPMGFDRHFAAQEGSQDCYGRCIWCLGFVTSRPALPEGLRLAADTLLRKVVHAAERLDNMRSCAYTVLGLSLWSDCPDCRQRVAEHCARIARHYHMHAGEGWQWFGSELSHCSAILPHATLAAHQLLNDEKCLEIGLESLHFLLEGATQEGFFRPVGRKSRIRRGGEPAPSHQRPVEACCTLLACLTAHRITGEGYYLDKAQLCLGWFFGSNSAGERMIDPETGGCYDGIRADGINHNQSGESLLAWYTSFLAMELTERGHAE